MRDVRQWDAREVRTALGKAERRAAELAMQFLARAPGAQLDPSPAVWSAVLEESRRFPPSAWAAGALLGFRVLQTADAAWGAGVQAATRTRARRALGALTVAATAAATAWYALIIDRVAAKDSYGELTVAAWLRVARRAHPAFFLSLALLADVLLRALRAAAAAVPKVPRAVLVSAVFAGVLARNSPPLEDGAERWAALLRGNPLRAVRRGAESTQAKVQHALYDARRRLAEFVAPPSDVPQVRVEPLALRNVPSAPSPYKFTGTPRKERSPSPGP